MPGVVVAVSAVVTAVLTPVLVWADRVRRFGR